MRTPYRQKKGLAIPPHPELAGNDTLNKTSWRPQRSFILAKGREHKYFHISCVPFFCPKWPACRLSLWSPLLVGGIVLTVKGNLSCTTTLVRTLGGRLFNHSEQSFINTRGTDGGSEHHGLSCKLSPSALLHSMFIPAKLPPLEFCDGIKLLHVFIHTIYDNEEEETTAKIEEVSSVLYAMRCFISPVAFSCSLSRRCGEALWCPGD
ncbi:hypothetical protein F5I97DRAFT_814635 [Phlebopus sp. FC_14]|nr:hypothetical protein F5I97DRAFT_814635 [Phlebopus sp. FC_14]